MQYEIKIVVYNPTMDEANFAGDVYARSFDPAGGSDGPTFKRIYCGPGGMTKQEAYADAVMKADVDVAKVFDEPIS